MSTNLDWRQMGCMEPDWYLAKTPDGEVSLHMNWDETTWLLCVWHEDAEKYEILMDTDTADVALAQERAEAWLPL